MLNIRTVPGSDAARSQASALSTVALAMVIVPQIVVRALSSSDRLTGVVIALGTAAATCVLAVGVARLLHRQVPRRSSHQLAERHLAHWAGLLVAAARILGYALILILGVELAVTSLEAVITIPWSMWLDPVLIIVVAIPVLTGVGKRHQRWIIALSFAAISALVVLLVYGLVQEAIGAIDVENIRLARRDAYSTEPASGESWPLFEAAIGGALLGGVTSQLSERVMASTAGRRVQAATLAKVMGAAVLVIGMTLYFVVVLQMPGQRVAIPSLSIAMAFFGDAGQLILAGLYVMFGLGVGYASYIQLPGLLRELALDGLLPRRLAAADVIQPRRLIIASIAAMAAIVTIVLDSTRSISSVFVLTMYMIVVLSSLAMVMRAKSTLNDSVNSQERRLARFNRWIFGGYTLIGILVAGAVVLVRPEWAVAGLVALSVPVAFLAAYSRGQIKLTEQLQLGPLATGRHLPTRVHGVVLLERVDEATIQAVTWARAMRLSSLTAVVVDIDPIQTRHIREAWTTAMVPVDITILGEPKGGLRGPVIEYVRARHRNNANDLIVVIIPRLISSSLWERFFLRHSTPRVVSDLRLEPNVIIAEVPYLLGDDDT